MPPSGSLKKDILVFVSITVIACLLYYPILGNTFLSDDYFSLYRICIEKRILFREVLRPMIDITFYLNYVISGMDAHSYYIFNVLVHIFNTFLLYKLAKKIIAPATDNQGAFALAGAFLFLIYPFHNEGIAWLSGRLSSLACLFSLISLNISLGKRNNYLAFILSAISFLIGLLCYEAIILLPAIIIILNWDKYKSTQQVFKAIALWSIPVALCLAARYFFSRQIYGTYGGRMFGRGVRGHFSTLLKTFGRLLLPPLENSASLTIIFGVVIAFLLFVHLSLFRKKAIGDLFVTKYVQLLMSLVISMIIPAAFGISTRTPEGDRLLYFPSCFLCMIIAFFLFYIVKNIISRSLTLLILLAYFIYFLQKNNAQWIKASHASNEILQTIKNNRPKGIVLINLPDELEGAVVFRNGFRQALVLNNIDTSKVIYTNLLSRLQYLKTGDPIIPVKQNDGLFVYPVINIQLGNDNQLQLYNSGNKKMITVDKRSYSVYYWDKKNLVKLF